MVLHNTKLHCFRDRVIVIISLSTAFTANTVRPCKELRGAPHYGKCGSGVLEFENIGFYGEGETGVPKQNLREQGWERACFLPGSISHRQISTVLAISAWTRVLPPSTNRQANGRVKLFLKSVGIVVESTFKNSWLWTRPFVARKSPQEGRFWALLLAFVELLGSYPFRESSDKVMPREFS